MSSGYTMVVAPIDQPKRDEGDKEFTNNPDNQRPPTLAGEIPQIRAQANSREGRKECPAGEIREAGELRMGEKARGRQYR